MSGAIVSVGPEIGEVIDGRMVVDKSWTFDPDGDCQPRPGDIVTAWFAEGDGVDFDAVTGERIVS